MSYRDLPEWHTLVAAIHDFNRADSKANGTPANLVVDFALTVGCEYASPELSEESSVGGLYCNHTRSYVIRGLLHEALYRIDNEDE